MAFSSALCKELPAANTTMRRFDARFFHVDFPLSAVCTILADTPNELHLNGEFRSNKDLVGLLWTSTDKYGHPLLAYLTDLNYSGTRLAFAANPPDPYNFTMTVKANSVDNVYRCFPYVVSGSLLVPLVTDPGVQGVGPGSTFAISEIFPDGLTVPPGYLVYVLDFDNLRLGFNYDGALVNRLAIQQIFFSLSPVSAGLGAGAKLANAGSMFSNGDKVQILSVENLTEWKFQNINPNLRLSKGDIIVASVSYPGELIGAGKNASYRLKNETVYIGVQEWRGDGTTERYVKATVPLENSVWIGGPALSFRLEKDTAIGNQTLSFSMVNMSCTGSRRDIPRRVYPQAPHLMEMTTGYDDTYNITPWRQLDNTYKLGYRGLFTIYMGMSHYFKAASTGGTTFFENKVVKDAAEPLNYPTEVWCRSLFTLAQVMGYEFVWSTSYEILNSYCPVEWAQKDYEGKNGLSGWVPPSAFVIPANLDATGPIAYLARVIKHGMKLLTESGATALRFQIGEPWWWDGSYSNGAPAIYDEYTRSKYTVETGNVVTTPFIADYRTPGIIDPGSPYLPYLQWLGVKLGQSTNFIRDSVKVAYPSALSTLLFFSPQIFASGVQNTPGLPTAPGSGLNGLLSIINFPIAEWKYPAYDFMQIEDYDWIIKGELEKLPLTREAALELLEYPLSTVHYFVGFVLLKKTTWIWPNINVATREAKLAGLSHIAVWAYPQVIRDGILYDDSIIETEVAMMPPIPPKRQMPAELGNDVVRPIYLCKIGDDIRMNSSDRNLQFEGETWYATGQFGSITPLSEGANKNDAGWTMTLQGIPLELLEQSLDSLRAKSATLYMGLFDAEHGLLHPPRIIGSGSIIRNNASVEETTGSVVVDVKSKFSVWNRSTSARYSDEYQQFKFPGDRGFRFLTALLTQKLNWGT